MTKRRELTAADVYDEVVNSDESRESRERDRRQTAFRQALNAVGYLGLLDRDDILSRLDRRDLEDAARDLPRLAAILADYGRAAEARLRQPVKVVR